MKVSTFLKDVQVTYESERGCLRVGLELIVPAGPKVNHDFQAIMIAAQSLGRITLSVDEAEIDKKVPPVRAWPSRIAAEASPFDGGDDPVARSW